MLAAITTSPDAAAAWSRALGGDPAAHRSRYLTPRVLRDADLVLGMAREHRREVVGLTPALTKTTFTLRELARLTAAVDGDERAQPARVDEAEPADVQRDPLVPGLDQRRQLGGDPLGRDDVEVARQPRHDAVIGPVDDLEDAGIAGHGRHANAARAGAAALVAAPPAARVVAPARRVVSTRCR